MVSKAEENPWGSVIDDGNACIARGRAVPSIKSENGIGNVG